MNVLRPYQQDAVDAVMKEFEEGNSTLVVAPTGSGKTEIFVNVIMKMLPKRALVLAHREELILQAFHRLRSYEVGADIEMADQFAEEHYYSRQPVVISTIQTQNSGNGERRRMHRFRPDDFSLVVCDEAHHYTAKSFRKVLDYFKQNKDIKILGLTATPDRADEEALGQVFGSVAFDYEILDAIHDGYLVPVDKQMVTVEGLDFSQIRTTAGDLNGADLGEVMEAEKNLQGIASSSIQIIGDRKTLAFTVTVKQAEKLAEIFNRHRPDMAEYICGATPKEDRHAILARFADGRTQVLCNVGVLTEGFDSPDTSVVIQARPTKSRCLYSQIIGRALRPLPGIIDNLHTADDRKVKIYLSDKPSALVVDFVGNAGRHKLMTTADILGGKVSEEVLDLAVEIAKKLGTPVRMDELIDEEKERMIVEMEERRKAEAARKACLVGKATFRAVQISPFDAFEIDAPVERGWDRGKTLSEKQTKLLRNQGVDPSTMSYAESKAIINTLFFRWKNKLCTLRQAAILKKRGYETGSLTMTEATKLIDEIAIKERWGRKN